jgi:hypothetical protein
MDEQLTGPTSGEAAAPEESRLAEQLIREEFGAATSVFDETAPVPVGATAAPAAEPTLAAGGAIHEEFAEPDRPSPSRNHRTGMLAGLGVVGALLAVLVLLSPGSGQPRLPVQSVHDISPSAASGPKTAAATVLPAALAATTSSTTSSTTAPSTTQPHRSAPAPTTVTYVYAPGATAPAPTTPTASAPAPTPTTAAPPPPTTTTTSPPTTTTTAKHCILGLIC